MSEAPPVREPGLPAPAKFELALFAVIVLACSQLGYVGHPRYGPFIAAADVLCAVLFAAWLAKVHREGRFGRILLPPTVLWLWLAMGVLSISKSALDAEGKLSLAGVKAGVIEVGQLGLYFVAGYMMFVDVFNSVAKIRRASAVLLGATTVVVAWGLMDYLTKSQAFQVKASFGNRNVYSAFLVMVVPLLFGVAIHERDRLQRRWVMLVAAMAALTMLGPPHVWLLTGILCWMAYTRGGRIRAYFIPCAVILALAINVGLPRNRATNVTELLDPFERGELYKLTGGEATQPGETPPLIVKKRWLEWQPALQMLADNLALGVGAGSYQRRIGEAAYYGQLPNAKKSEPDADNLYLVLGASMGFPALVCLVALLARFRRQAKSLWLRAGSTAERGLAAGLPGAVVGIMVANLFSSLLVRGVSLIWALVFAMITTASREGIASVRRRAGISTTAPNSEVSQT
jgi:hypothetical protein